MARIRYIKPEFFEDITMAELSRDARLLYIGLWCFFDRHGITDGDTRLIKKNVFPLDDDMPAKRVSELIDELENLRRIVKFSFEGREYILCPRFARHQLFHSREQVKYAIPEEILSELSSAPYKPCTSTVLAPYKSQTCVTNYPFPIPHSSLDDKKTQQSLDERDQKLAAAFAAAKSAYPKRKGDNRFKDAFKVFKRDFLQTEKQERLLVAIKNYSTEMEASGKVNTSFVKQFATFLNGPWEEWVEVKPAYSVNVTPLKLEDIV